MVLSKKGYPTPQREKKIEVGSREDLLLPEPLQHETYGKNLYPRSMLLDQHLAAIKQLNSISEVLLSELRVYPDCLPTSFVDAETQLAKYISQCLECSSTQNVHIEHIRALLRDYRVFRFAHHQKRTVSLRRVHAILQDNFPDSYLCKLFDLLIMGDKNTEAKVITFF